MGETIWKFPGKRQPEGPAFSFDVPPGSPWFDGHFAENPILPGIALLHHAWLTAQEILDPEMELAGLCRVKFKRLVRPGEALTVQFDAPAPEAGNEAPFAVLANNENCCTGYFLVRPAQHKTDKALED